MTADNSARSGVTIRPSRTHDIATLQAIEIAAAELFRGTGLIDLTDEDSVDADEHHKAIHSGMSFVAEADGTPAGFVLGHAIGQDAYLHELDVDPAHQRKGIGAGLIEAFCAHCARKDLTSVYLSTFRDVPWNAPFYARLGFEEVAKDDYLPWMREIEAQQAEFLDISKRLFMRRVL